MKTPNLAVPLYFIGNKLINKHIKSCIKISFWLRIIFYVKNLNTIHELSTRVLLSILGGSKKYQGNLFFVIEWSILFSYIVIVVFRI